MRSLLESYLKRDPSAKSLFEVTLLYPGPKAIFFHRIANRLYKSRLFFLARAVSEFSRWMTLIEIHPGAKLGKNLVLDHGAGIVIGETAIIGDNCLIYQGVTLGATSQAQLQRHPILEEDVVIGAGAKIIGAITIRKGAVVGANSVVTKSINDGETVAGVPAMLISKKTQGLSGNRPPLTST